MKVTDMLESNGARRSRVPRTCRRRSAALAGRRVTAAAAIVLATAIPAMAAPKGTPAPSFQLRSPSAGPYGGDVVIRWRWTGSRAVGNARVRLSVVGTLGIPQVIGVSDHTRNGVFVWHSKDWLDDRYTITGTVVGVPGLTSQLEGVIVDNTPPSTAITKPAPGYVVVADQWSGAGVDPKETVVIGAVTLTVSARDLDPAPSIEWFVDGRKIGEGRTLPYDFPASYARHLLTVQATDWVGNVSRKSVLVRNARLQPASCIADQIADGTVPPEPACASATPGPVPSEQPSLPDSTCVTAVDADCLARALPPEIWELDPLWSLGGGPA